MNRGEILLEIDAILGLRAGTVRGNENLEELPNWDSVALISLIALAEENGGVRISPEQVVRCSTVDDLLKLAEGGRDGDGTTK